MDPRYRFALVVSFLLMAWWLYVVVSTYLFGTRGLNLERYQEGLLLVGGSTFAGFAMVWAASRIILWQRNRKTGFEAEAMDEFKTRFTMLVPVNGELKEFPFKISLSKFLPQTVAVPEWPGLTPLEAELIGFLNAYRHWPVDLETSQQSANKMVSLYEQAFARWQIMRHLPGTGPWHRVIALSKDLALIHAYKEVRSSYPLLQFWKRDKVKFVRRCQAHGGIAAFVLSTLPAFRAMGSTPEGLELQRSLLTALRYHENPSMLPLNSAPLARELVDYLWRAEAQIKQLDMDEVDQMTPERVTLLQETLPQQWLGFLTAIVPEGSPGDQVAALKQADGTVWVSLSAVFKNLAPLLPSELRQVLRLWESQDGNTQHPAWIHLAPALLDAGLIANTHNGIAAVNGCFTLQTGSLIMGPMVKLILDPTKHYPALKQWQGIQGYPDALELLMDMDQLTTITAAKSNELDNRLGVLF